MIFAGIGSRDTPTKMLIFMCSVAKSLANRGYTLRSGHAQGADQAFEEGFKASTKKEIFVAEDCTAMAMEHSSHYHPAWHLCSPMARKLHGRNSMILLGQNLDTPVDFVICWTRDGLASGGTGQGIRIANAHGIPVFNLYYKKHVEFVTNYFTTSMKGGMQGSVHSGMQVDTGDIVPYNTHQVENHG